ncbi:hypothetical protein diail_3750 [Diaporthe ilicicola]|nr:hypothetical protein diail_3750 [Diaporthe ilicicola]
MLPRVHMSLLGLSAAISLMGVASQQVPAAAALVNSRAAAANTTDCFRECMTTIVTQILQGWTPWWPTTRKAYRWQRSEEYYEAMKALGTVTMVAPFGGAGDSLEVFRYYSDELQAMQINVYVSGLNMISAGL